MNVATLDQNPNTELGKATLLAMAAASGIAVANIYYSQPMLGFIEAEFPGQSATDLISTSTQLGYALGLFLLLPLGDLVHRRRLIIGQFVILAVALSFAAVSQSAWMLVAGSFLVGASSTVAQQIVPFAASLAPAEKRGATIGTVTAGVLSGILFGRALSGLVGEYSGWREMFWIAVPMALTAALMMFLTLPDHAPVSRMAYRDAIKSLAHLWKGKPSLRTAAVVQASLFASFTAFWTVLSLYLEGPDFGLGADVAGLFGIIGAVGLFAAPIAGKAADKRGPHFVVWVGAMLTLLSWVIFGIGASIVALAIGVIVLIFGIQSALVSNQHIIYALEPEARSRLNTIFMTGMFLGGAAGSALALAAWTYGSWNAVTVVGGVLPVAALAIKAIRAS
ncbi:MFS transporter [Ensifer adhaerens]|uniref:MFS transporter n=1 Tax=Ensifer adhaerens TaxID=106592 RepID=UPI001CBF949A|nr:MFS transporter [Ensifer adhaerens]MBZ7924172.1 MFS transporter [Ensifer adhaerens]UAX96569.1 MFS transporter [Ensifer adhaerens]UAY04087.1 MFS transporter [Ensifer adhaerens]UAY12073.1 MFS transporter [Ensifer adhaerens]